MMNAVQTPGTIAEIEALLQALPKGDDKAVVAVRERDGQLTKPPGALARLEDIAFWLARWQGRAEISADDIRVVVFAGNHGVTAQGVSAFPAEVTVQMVANFQAGGAAINQLCRQLGARLDVVALDLDSPTADITEAPAMTEDEFIRAFATGFNAVDGEADLLCVGEMGIGNTTIAAALCHGLYGGKAGEWTGPGTGLDGDGVNHKAEVVSRAVARHAGLPPLELLRALGGREIAAMAGAVLAARLRSVPVILDGYVCCAAVAPLEKASPGALDHCLAGHRSAEPAHACLLEHLGKQPLLDLGMRLGEASGAALAANIVRAAVATHRGMATFAEAAVAGKER